eukprot:m.47114 g.47114  ORF g.47114 m.47114 type:complete len:86 (-) comp20419_c0_seq1:63-320(-)
MSMSITVAVAVCMSDIAITFLTRSVLLGHWMTQWCNALQPSLPRLKDSVANAGRTFCSENTCDIFDFVICTQNLIIRVVESCEES